MKPTESKAICRIVVLGAQKTPLGKTMSILAEPDLQQILNQDPATAIDIQFLPCVVTFDSYQDQNGKMIRYLQNVSYHYDLIQASAYSNYPSNILEIFDQLPHTTSRNGGKDDIEFPKIAGIFLVTGTEDEDDIRQISSYFSTLLASPSQEDAIEPECIPFEYTMPNQSYSTMREEQIAFKEMTPDQKERVTEDRLLGPGKMARLVADFTRRIVQTAVENMMSVRDKDEMFMQSANNVEEAKVNDQNHVVDEEEVNRLREIDPCQERYACRMCRTILFGADDLQNPPHEPAQHLFGYRKHDGARGRSGSCQSFFLQDALEWMGDMNEDEGRISCPKCKSKVGGWHWSGAQCSCGTWVVPAIQIPQSKVDVIPPQTTEMSVSGIDKLASHDSQDVFVA